MIEQSLLKRVEMAIKYNFPLLYSFWGTVFSHKIVSCWDENDPTRYCVLCCGVTFDYSFYDDYCIYHDADNRPWRGELFSLIGADAHCVALNADMEAYLSNESQYAVSFVFYLNTLSSKIKNALELWKKDYYDRIAVLTIIPIPIAEEIKRNLLPRVDRYAV